MDRRPARVAVIGWYHRNNAGDESYKLAFPRVFPNDFFEFDETSITPDACVLGGGHVLSETFLKKTLQIPCKSKIAMSVSAGNETPFELLSQFQMVYGRDLRTVSLLKEKGIPSCYMPDVAICLKPNPENGNAWLKSRYQAEKLELYQRKIVVVLNAHLIQGKPDILARDYIKFLAAVQDLSKVADQTMASFVFLPMSTGFPYDDRVPNGFVASRCKFWRKNLVIYERLDVQTTLDIISACDAVISTRLHSSIFSFTAHVPFIDLTHHDKTRGFTESINWDHKLSYWNFSTNDVIKNLEFFSNNLSDLKVWLTQSHTEQLELQQKVAADVCFLE